MEIENRRLNDIQVQMKRLALIGIAACLCLGACERRELTYYMESEITVTADWSMAGLEEEREYGATLIAYPKDGGAPKVVLMGNRTGITFRLPRGKYDMILFNRSFDDFSSLAFRGKENLETLEAYAKKVETRPETQIIISAPERLATAVIRNFEVTDEMLGNYTPASTRTSICPEGACHIQFIPVPITQKTQVELRIKGLDNLKKATCTMTGIPLSVFLYNGSAGKELGAQDFTTGNPIFDEGSQTNGKLTGELNLFGLSKEEDPQVILKALLVDGKTTVEQQIGDVEVRQNEDGNGSITVYVEAEAPESLPDVKPEEDVNSGFDADVDEWGNETVTEIPI